MGFEFERRSYSMDQPRETKENTITSEKLKETEKKAEKFDNYEDCSIKGSKRAGIKEVDSKSLEKAEEDYEDCRTNLEEMKKKNPELSKKDYDEYDDCGKKTEGKYVAEVTYVKKSDVSDAKVEAELQDAYSDCKNPEDMKELKENVNENEDVKVIDAKVIERPEMVENTEMQRTAEEYEAVEEAAIEAQESLEEQQEAAELYQDELKVEAKNSEIAENISENKVDNADINENVDVDTIEQEEKLKDAVEKINEEAEVELTDKEAEEVKEYVEKVVETSAEEGKIDEATIQEVIDEKVKGLDAKESEKIEKKSFDERLEEVINKDKISGSELKELKSENIENLEKSINEKAELDKEISRKFDEVISKERGSEEYKEALKEYNALKDYKNELDDKIAMIEGNQKILEKKSQELREEQFIKGTQALDASVVTLASVKELQKHYDETYYEKNPNKEELANIRADGDLVIKEIDEEKNVIRQAMDAKMDEMSEYIHSNHLEQYETERDPHYQKLVSEYKKMKEQHDRLEYASVKLDENNKSITELLDGNYMSVNERKVIERIEISEAENQEKALFTSDYESEGNSEKRRLQAELKRIEAEMDKFDPKTMKMDDYPAWKELNNEKNRCEEQLEDINTMLNEAKSFERGNALEISKGRVNAVRGDSEIARRREWEKDKECVRNNEAVLSGLRVDLSESTKEKEAVRAQIADMLNTYEQDELLGNKQYKELHEKYNILSDKIETYERQIKALERYNQQLAEINGKDEIKEIFKDTIETREVKELSEKVHYLDKVYNDAKNALAYNPERKEDWDVVRDRLSDEYKSKADMLQSVLEEKVEQFNELRREYFEIHGDEDSPVNTEKLEELRLKGIELNKEIETAKFSARHAEYLSAELEKGLDPERRSIYYGIGGNAFTTLHKSMIQEQGYAVADFKGTCGECSVANTIIALGEYKTEAEVVQRARELRECTDKKIPPFWPESAKEIMRSKNGGTTVDNRTKILNSFGYECDNRINQSLLDIAQQIEKGKAAIIDVDHRVLNKQRSVTTMNPVGIDHALTVTAVEKDVSGNIIGLWIHDTGVCSNMGNAFYCNAKDYNIWKNNPRCTVQYISKKSERSLL